MIVGFATLLTLLTLFLPIWTTIILATCHCCPAHKHPHSLVFTPTTNPTNMPITPLTFGYIPICRRSSINSCWSIKLFFAGSTVNLQFFGWIPGGFLNFCRFFSPAFCWTHAAPVASPSVVVKATAEPAGCEGIDPSNLRCALIWDETNPQGGDFHDKMEVNYGKPWNHHG